MHFRTNTHIPNKPPARRIQDVGRCHSSQDGEIVSVLVLGEQLAELLGILYVPGQLEPGDVVSGTTKATSIDPLPL